MSANVTAARRYRMKCLGPVVLEGPSGTRLGLRTRKQLGLLFYLARRAKPVARDELIELFWGEDDARLARHSLSQCASLINKMLGAEIIVTAGRDRLAVVDSAVAIDVSEFERLVAEGRHDEALALWRGPLFEGIWVQRAPEFERWLSQEREKVQRLFRRLVHARIEVLRNRGDHQEIRDEAERLLQHDPLDETAMHAYLESLTLLGDRSLALRRYAEFEARLDKELEAEPGAALKTWVKRQRKGETAPSRDTGPIPRISEITVLPAAQPFYGRTEEFSTLWKAWEAAGTGRGSFIIIEGEAGIGKTALATKLANQAHVAGGSVCFVKCYRMDKSVPFAPISMLIRQLSRLPGFVALDPIWIGELTRLAPELRDRFSQAPQPMAVDETARHRLSDAAALAAVCVADEQPLMIVVDDLQDADEASLSLLHYLARQSSGQPILIVGAKRTVQDISDLERAFFDSQATLGQAINLCALSTDEVSKVVLQVVAKRGLSIDGTGLESIVHLAEGNPLRAIEAASRENAGDSQHRETDQGKDHFDLSASDRLAALPSSPFMVAGAIALAGRPLSQYEIHKATELSVAELAGALSRLESDHFIHSTGGGLGFIHERYAAALEALLGQETRVELHLRLAQLCRRGADKNPAARYDAARHYAAAGMAREARLQALRAAQYAKSLGAIRERAAALVLASSSGEPDYEVSADLGECYLDLRDFDNLRTLCDTICSTAGTFFPADFLFLGIAAEYHAGAASLSALTIDLAELLAQHPGFRLEARARTLLMRLSYKSGRPDAFRSAAKSLRRSLSHQGISTRAHALLATAYLAAKLYCPKRALPILRQALEVARANHDLDLEHHIRTGIGAVCRQLGKFRESIEELEVAWALAERTLNPQQQASDQMDIAVSEMSRGNLVRAEALLSRADELFRSHPDRVARLLLVTNQAELCLYRGEVTNAKHLLDSVVDQSWQSHEIPRHLQILGGLGLCAQRLGNARELKRISDEMIGLRAYDAQVCHERWLIEATLAWNRAINLGDAVGAVDTLVDSANALARRDIDHCLMMDVEQHRIRLAFGYPDQQALRKVLEKAESIGADLVARAFANLLAETPS